jgi:hypothetical protein
MRDCAAPLLKTWAPAPMHADGHGRDAAALSHDDALAEAAEGAQ